MTMLLFSGSCPLPSRVWRFQRSLSFLWCRFIDDCQKVKIFRGLDTCRVALVLVFLLSLYSMKELNIDLEFWTPGLYTFTLHRSDGRFSASNMWFYGHILHPVVTAGSQVLHKMWLWLWGIAILKVGEEVVAKNHGIEGIWASEITRVWISAGKPMDWFRTCTGNRCFCRSCRFPLHVPFNKSWCNNLYHLDRDQAL